MLVRYAKAGALVVVFVVLVVEGFFVYRWYDRYVWSDAASGDVPGVVSPEAGTSPEDTAAEETTAAGDAPPDTTAVHRATEENSRGDYTYLTNPGIDGDPDAVVLASPTGSYAHNVSVWYEPGAGRWAVFNQDRAPVPAGAAFEVSVPERSGGFVHRAELANTVGNATYLDNPATNGEPDAALSVTQNWNPGGSGGTYNDHPVGVLYDEDVGKWSVYNRDGGPMPEGAAFNVAVSGGA